MNEEILKKYFEGTATVKDLDKDLIGTVKIERNVSRHMITNFSHDSDFNVKSIHLIKLCDDVLNENLKLSDLGIIAFALVASDYFSWDSETIDGERVSEVIFQWDSPEINYPLTKENVKLWLHYLKTGEFNLKLI